MPVTLAVKATYSLVRNNLEQMRENKEGGCPGPFSKLVVILM